VSGSTPADERRELRVFGFWTCLALVVGNMIGSGFYLLPASLAPFGWNGVFGWLVTIGGALCLAAVFGALARAFPKAGGPYAYSRTAFGPLVGFLVAWSYWASLPIGNAAIATGVVAPLATLSPTIERHSVLVTCGLVWSLTAVNCFDARLVGRIQIVTAALKFIPLAAIILLACLILGGGEASLPPILPEQLQLAGSTGIGAAAAITLWAFLGLESATVPAERVAGEGRTILKATLIGTAITGLIYVFAASAVVLLTPSEQLSGSGAPIAVFVRSHWGDTAALLITLAAAVTAFGALNGWILLQGEMPWAMARDGVLPTWLAKASGRGVPVRAHLVSSTLLTILLLINQARGLADLFTFLVLLATLAALLPYFVCSLAALRLRGVDALRQSGWVPPLAVLGALYSAWAIWGSGIETIAWGLLFLALGLPVYAMMRRRSAGPSG
jgi:APA family basic amino acid/polyamine antiporter